MSKKTKINLLLTLFILILIYPTFKLTQQRQENRNLAKEKKAGQIEIIKPVEEKKVKLETNRVAETKIASKNEKLMVRFEKGVLDKQGVKGKELKLTLLPTHKSGEVLKFSLELLEENKLDKKNAIPFSANISSSLKNYEISYDVSDLNEVYALSTLSFIYHNPVNGKWEKIPTTFDNKNNRISAKLDHFSDFGVTGAKAQVFSPTLKSWETSLYTGAVTNSVPIELLPGKGGLTPSLTASYNSNTANAAYGEQKGSWLGVGWDLALSEIRFDENVDYAGLIDCTNGVGTRKVGPQYSLIINGVEEPLVWIGDDVSGQGQFISKSSNMEIKATYGVYKNNSTFGTACRNKIITKWTVRDTNGTDYVFEVKGTGNTSSVADRKIKNVYVPTKYMLTLMTDVYGNTVEYEYQVPAVDLDSANGHIYATYMNKIWYNNRKTLVQFYLSPKENYPTLTGEDRNFEKSRLSRIEIYSDASISTPYLYKTYRFIYYPKATYGFDALKKIIVYAAGSVPSETADPNGDMAVKNKQLPTEFVYEKKPVGIQVYYLSANQFPGPTCDNGWAPMMDLPVRKTTWNDLADYANSKDSNLKSAGFGDCSGGDITRKPTISGNCPISSEGDYYTIDGSFDCGGYGGGVKSFTVQGTLVYWEEGSAPFVNKITNGYGGEVYFTYENQHVGKFGLNHNVVISKRISDVNFKDKGTPDVTINYTYHPIVEDGSGRMLNNGGGFGRVTETDPVTGMLTTTTFYPLAPLNGDGGVNPNVDPFFGSPLRTVVHKIEGTNDLIYSDTFYTYSFLPPLFPNLGLTENALNIERNRQSWRGWKTVDNLLLEGFGKKINAVTDSFMPKETNSVTVPYDKLKPQYISDTIRRTNFYHNQERSGYDKYGYQIKSSSLGEVVDSTNGFSISETRADLSTGRNSNSGGVNLDSVKFWWLSADQFTYGLPFTPILFTAYITGVSDNGYPMKDGWYTEAGDCDSYIDVCCLDGNVRDHEAACGWLCDHWVDTFNRNQFDQCKNFNIRSMVVNDPAFSGLPGNLAKYSYTKYLRTTDFLAKNMTGLSSESFISDQDISIDNYISPSFVTVAANKWKLTENSYNDKGRLISVKLTDTSTNRETDTPAEITSSVSYDEVGNVVAQTDGKGNVSYVDYYNTADKPYYKILPVTQRQSFVRADGVVVNISTSTSYDNNWRPVKNVDPNGVESVIDYDCLGRLQNVYKPEANTGLTQTTPSVTYFYYDYQAEGCGLGAVGNIPHLRTKTRISSSTSDNQYIYSDQISDGLGNNKESIILKTKINGTEKGLVSEVVYNNRGLKDYETQPTEVGVISESIIPSYISLTSPLKTSYTYDELGRVTKITDPLGNQNQTWYGGKFTRVLDANNIGKANPTMTTTYIDALGRTEWTQITNLLDNSNNNSAYALLARNKYNVLDQVIKISNYKCVGTQTNGEAYCNANEVLLFDSTVSYDALGRKWQVSDPDLGTWKYAYDANGNIVKQTDAKNQVLAYEYDPLNRLTKKIYPDGKFIQNIYDKDGTNVMIGKKLRMIDLVGENSAQFDKRGRLKNQHLALNKSIAGGVGQEIADTTFSYFESDALKSTTLPTGETVEQKINEVGQLVGIKGNEEYLKESEPPLYNKFGMINRSKLGNGLQSYNEYDLLGRIQRICVGTDCVAGTNKLMDYKYPERDKVGNILAINNEVAGESAFNLSYTYDSLYQLTGASGKYNTTYNYDPLGNMTKKDEGGVVNMQFTDNAHKHAPKVVNGFTYVYDANGNLTEDEARCLVWDFDNKPKKIILKQTKGEAGCASYLSGTKTGVMTEYAYDGDGNRVMKKVTGETAILTPTPTTGASNGDYNNDGKINYWDTIILLKNWLTGTFDLNKDNKVNAVDFALHHLLVNPLVPTPTPISGGTATPSLTPTPTNGSVISPTATLTPTPTNPSGCLGLGEDCSFRSCCPGLACNLVSPNQYECMTP